MEESKKKQEQMENGNFAGQAAQFEPHLAANQNDI